MALPKFHIVGHVTVPVLKLDTTKPNYITFLEPIHLAAENDKQKAAREAQMAAGKQVKPVPEICKVTNLADGKVYQIVANEVFKSELRAAYPEDGYVSKSFAVHKFAPGGDKNYATFQIAEIALDPEDGEGEGEGSEHVQDAAPQGEAQPEGKSEGETPAETQEAHTSKRRR